MRFLQVVAEDVTHIPVDALDPRQVTGVEGSMENNSVLEEPQGLAVLPPILVHGRRHLRRDREPHVFPEPCQPLDRPVGEAADFGVESPGKLRGTPFKGLSSTVAEPLALSPLPLHPSQLGPSSSGNTVDGLLDQTFRADPSQPDEPHPPALLRSGQSWTRTL